MKNEIFDNMLSRYDLTTEQHKRNAIFEVNQQTRQYDRPQKYSCIGGLRLLHLAAVQFPLLIFLKQCNYVQIHLPMRLECPGYKPQSHFWYGF